MTAPDPRIQIPPWTVVRGDAFTQPVTINDTSGNPVNLTSYGSSFASQLRGGPDYTTSVPFTVDATNAATGQLVMSLTAEQTASMNLPVYYFDIQVTGGTVSPQTPAQGVLIVFKDYTQ